MFGKRLSQTGRKANLAWRYSDAAVAADRFAHRYALASEPHEPRMSATFEILDHQLTTMGDLSLRRRLEPTLQVDVYEARLGDEYLMSSLFTASETELATLTLAELPDTPLDIVVGGLGLGYTASAALNDPRVRSLHVIEALDEVIGWHRRQLLPLSAELTTDSRCHMVNGDFFALVASHDPFGHRAPERCHALLVDIDHTPDHHLHPGHASFYTTDGLRQVARRLHPGGILALWSDAPPDTGFVATAERAFTRCDAHIVRFPNPHTGGHSTSTVYLARTT